MANKAYRSIATGNWSNSTGTVWAVYSLTASGGVFGSGGTWSTAAANDYPTTGDYVWIQSTFTVTYDSTAISANNSATFAQISNRTDANGSAIAQPATGGVNATTGNIALSVANTTTINASQYSILAGSVGLFSISASNTTFNFTGNINEGTTGSFSIIASGSGITINFTGNMKAGTTTGKGISLTANNSTINIIGDVIGKGSDCLYLAGTGNICTVTGNVYGSDANNSVYGITTFNVTNYATITVTGNVYSGVNSSAIYAPNALCAVTVTGNIQNYGSSGSTSYVAIMAATLNIRSTSTQAFRTSDSGLKNFTTSGATTVTETSIWSYAQRELTSAKNITSDTNYIDQTKIANLDATVSSRLATSGYTAPDNTTIGTINTNVNAIKTKTDNLPTNTATQLTTIQTATDRIPTNPASVQSTGDQISTLQ